MWGQTPLWVACCYGRPEEAQLLLEVSVHACVYVCMCVCT